MDTKKCLAYTCTFVAALLLLTGCTDLAGYQSRVAKQTASFLSDLDQDMVNRKIQIGPGPLSLSFSDACIYAALVDVNIVELLAGLEKSKIGVESASSNVWPRLNMQLQTELAIGNSNHDDVVTGGLFLRYDIIKALTSGDEKAVREAFVLKDVVNIRLAVNGLAQKLSKQMTAIVRGRFKLEKKKEILEMTHQAFNLAKIYSEQGRATSETVWRWDDYLDQRKVDVLQAEQELLIAERVFNSTLGLSGTTKISISDEDEIMKERFVPDDDIPSVSTIWSRHGQARLAEINYIAAEANLKQVKVSGWPKITADLGIGSIPITTEDDTSDSVVTLSLQVPLIDMGDHRRKVDEAEITLDVVKTGLKKVAERLWISADNARTRFEQATKQYRYIVSLHNKALEEQKKSKELYREEYIDTLVVIPRRIQLLELEVRLREAADIVYEAAIEYNLAIGNDFSPDFSAAIFDDLLAKRLFVRSK